MSMCPSCGGLVMEEGKVYGYAGPTCRCMWGHLPHKPVVHPLRGPTGWQCPVCGSVNGPHVAVCPTQHTLS